LVGGAKAAQDEQDERGWASADAFVCQQCVSEDALCAALSAREEPRKECSFCGNLPATPLDVLLEHFVAGLRNAYDYAKDELFWDGREGGYQGDTLNTWDVVDQFADVFVGDGLLGAVRTREVEHGVVGLAVVAVLSGEELPGPVGVGAEPGDRQFGALCGGFLPRGGFVPAARARPGCPGC